MVLLEWGEKKLISGILGGNNCNQDPLVLKNQKCGRNDRLIGIEKNLVKEVGTEIENGNDHVNVLMIGTALGTIERIDIIEIGIGLGIGKGKEIVAVIEIEIVVVIGSEDAIVIGRGIVIAIVKGTGTMKLGILNVDARMIGSLIMIVLIPNMRRTDMVKGSETMNLRMIVHGTIKLSMDIGMQTLIVMLRNMITMSIIKDEGIMIVEMVTTMINILTMIGWRMTTIMNTQHLNLVTGREIVIQRGLVLEIMISSA